MKNESKKDFEIHLVPYPKALKDYGEDFLVYDNHQPRCTIVIGSDATSLEEVAAAELQKAIKKLGAELPIVKEDAIQAEKNNGIAVVIGTADTNHLINRSNEVKASLDGLSNQGYLIKPSFIQGTEAVIAAANDPSSVLYACVTLADLFHADDDSKIKLRKAEIRDWPDIPYRGGQRFIHTFSEAPTSRFFEIGVNNWQDVVDRSVELKLNTLVIHSACGMGAEVLISIGGKEPRWREDILRTTEYAKKKGMKVYLTLYHSMEAGGKVLVEGKSPCGMDKDNMELWKNTFESIVKEYPQLDGFNIHVTEWERCTCPACQETSFAEEFIIYINEYYKILKKYNPQADLSVCAYYDIFKEAMKYKDKLPDDIINLLWTDTSPKSGLPYFLADIEDCIEFEYLSAFQRTSYWLYMNSWVDVNFPCATHYKSRSEALKETNTAEVIMGEFGFYRWVEYNMLALSQYTWDTQRPIEEFRRHAVAKLYGRKSLDELISLHKSYEEVVEKFLSVIWKEGNTWKNKETTSLTETSEEILGILASLRSRWDIPVESGLCQQRFDALKTDVEILSSEINVRLNLRRAYLSWTEGQAKIEDGKWTEGEKQMENALSSLKAAKDVHEELMRQRSKRGVIIPRSPSVLAGKWISQLIEDVKKVLQNIKGKDSSFQPDWDSVSPLFRAYHVW